jgi:ketosteroid isomerase-like protein
VATVNTLHTGHLIDAAFLSRPRAASRPELRLAAGQEQAMAQRLQQLQAALGDENAGIPGNSMPQAATTLAPATRHFSTTSMLLAILVSATLGASAMWFAVTANTSHAESPLAPVVAQVSPAVLAASTTPVPAAPAASVADETQIENALESWLQAWRDRNIAAYLAAYGDQFTPADGSSHRSWVAARTKKLASATTIDVQIRDVAMTRQAPDLFKVSFRQDYTAGNYRETGRAKTLLVARSDGRWQIVREQQD